MCTQPDFFLVLNSCCDEYSNVALGQPIYLHQFLSKVAKMWRGGPLCPLFVSARKLEAVWKWEIVFRLFVPPLAPVFQVGNVIALVRPSVGRFSCFRNSPLPL